MASTRNTILTAFKNVIDGMDAGPFGTLSAEIELLKAHRVGTKFHVEVWWHGDFGGFLDTQKEQEIEVTTRVKFKHDPSATDARGRTQILQASELYDRIHAAIETAYKNRKAGETPFNLGYLTIQQVRPGIQCDGFDDSDDHLMIGEVWLVKYRRAEGTT